MCTAEPAHLAAKSVSPAAGFCFFCASDLSARPAAAPQRPTIARLMDEIEATDPDICKETLFFRALRRFVTEGYANDIKDVTLFSVAFNEIIRDSPGFEQEVAQTLRHEAHWDCPTAVIETAVKNMRAAGLPKSIADALYEAQMPKPTTATKTTKMHGINPEPAPTDCMTCCEPFDQQKLIKCKTPNCTYLQCISCVIKGGGGACARPGCMQVHMDCPQCRESQHLDRGRATYRFPQPPEPPIRCARSIQAMWRRLSAIVPWRPPAHG